MDWKPVDVDPTEQIVFATPARVLPTLSEVIVAIVFAPTLMLMPWLIVHNLFRKRVYIVTTTRVIVQEPQGRVADMPLRQIERFQGGRTFLMLRGGGRRLWLPRLQDAWRFETIIRRTSEQMGMAR